MTPDWTPDIPKEPGRYLFHGHPDAQVKGILGEPVTEFVQVTTTQLGGLPECLLFGGPGMFGPRAAVGLWFNLEAVPVPERTWPWANLEVVRLLNYAKPEVLKPSGEKWYMFGEEGVDIIGLSVPSNLVVPLWSLALDTLGARINALIDVYTQEEGHPPARVIQFIRPTDFKVGLAAGGRP